MAHYNGRTFEDQTELLDDNEYRNCAFIRCRLTYWGGVPPVIVGCRISECTWHFEEAAARTISFMRGIYHGMGPQGRALIEMTLNPPQSRQPAQGA